MEYLVPIIVAVLSFIGTLAGSYFANRKSTALLNYRMEQLELQVKELKQEVKEMREK